MKNRADGSMLEKGLDVAGGVVDDVFLMLPKVLRRFKPPRKTAPQAYRQEIEFYFAAGYVKQPETFFCLEDAAPEEEILKQIPYRDGIYQVIAFQSGYEPKNPFTAERFHSFPENRTAYLVRWSHGDRGRKTLICLHGYMLGDPAQAEKMFRVQKLYNMGLDVALFITPFHWRRAPGSRMMRGIFLQPDDVPMTCECFGQAMHDLYRCVILLKRLGADEIGIIGASLGGYLAGLFACLTGVPAFAALMVPAVLFTGEFSPGAVRHPFPVDPEMLERIDTVWRLHSPLNFQPKIPKERLLVVASRGDKLCPFDHVRALCEKWGWPRHLFMTGGHWMVFNARERGRVWYRFLGDMGFIK